MKTPDTENPQDDATTLGNSLMSSILLPARFSSIAATKRLISVEICRPPNMTWVMTHPSFTVERCAVIMMQDTQGSGIYVVRNDIIPHVSSHDLKFVELRLAVTLSGTPFLWHLREGEDLWAQSAREAALLAMGSWVRLQSDRQNGRYEASTPQGNLPAPVWPTIDFDEIVGLAMKNRLIDSPSHPVLKLLKGHL